MSEKFTAYITRYALSSGIRVDEVVGCFAVNEKMVRSVKGAFYHKPYWHRTPEEATAHAGEMRAARIASLRKQLAKTEKLDFSKAVR